MHSLMYQCTLYIAFQCVLLWSALCILHSNAFSYEVHFVYCIPMHSLMKCTLYIAFQCVLLWSALCILHSNAFSYEVHFVYCIPMRSLMKCTLYIAFQCVLLWSALCILHSNAFSLIIYSFFLDLIFLFLCSPTNSLELQSGKVKCFTEIPRQLGILGTLTESILQPKNWKANMLWWPRISGFEEFGSKFRLVIRH